MGRVKKPYSLFAMLSNSDFSSPSPPPPAAASSSDDDRNHDPDPNPNPNPTPNSIDQSLDAIENQLASISMSQPVTDSETELDFDAPGTSQLNREQLKELRNGSFHEEIEDADGEEEPTFGNLLAEASSSRAGSSTLIWRSNSEADETDALPSPSSSAYAGERGSSVSSSRGSGIGDEIREVGNDDSGDGASESNMQWTPGKRHGDEVGSDQLSTLANSFFFKISCVYTFGYACVELKPCI